MKDMNATSTYSVSLCNNCESSMFSEYPDVVTVSDLALMLNVGRNTAYELVRAKIIESVKIGRQIRLSKQAVIDYICRCENS